jgi:hypothetical protein
MPYNPSIAPDARGWLALSEAERLDEVREYHDRTKARLPNAALHAAMHVTIENQLAENYGPAVVTLARLISEGLQRHDAIHAIASVAAVHLHELMQRGAAPFDQAAYERDLTALTADAWKANAG